MPEGDTIHRAAGRISRALAGAVPEELRTPHPRHRHERWRQLLSGRALTRVDAHGKHLLLRFEGALTLHSHLRMSGAWEVVRDGERWRRPSHRAWLVMRGRGWEAVQFDGPVLELMSDARARSHPQLAALGQDVIAPDFDSSAFLRRLRRGEPARPIGDALLDQTVIAGIGNLWKSETCFALAVDPWRALADVGDEQALALVGFAREHMAAAVREGAAARPRTVYRRAGRPCPRCGAAILQRGQGENNRQTFWCPSCQR